MAQTELQHLAHIRENGVRANRLLQTINANITTLVTLQVETNNRSRAHLDLLQEISDALSSEVDLDELETNVKRLKKVADVTKQYDASVVIPPKKWWVGQRVVVSEPSSALVGYQGELVAIIGNDSIAVLLDDRGTEAKHFHVNHLTPIPEKIVLPDYNVVKDANDVELPAVIDKTFGNQHTPDDQGRLFPWQWRHNLGWDKITEDLREYHRTHENHPMTEEAFRVYNAGLTAEIAVNDKKGQL